MTYREKLQKEHPGCINEYSLGGCDGCPYEYEYEKKKEEICEVSDEKCRKCWDREIPGTEEKKPLDAASVTLIAETYGLEKQLIKLIEECGELVTAAAKYDPQYHYTIEMCIRDRSTSHNAERGYALVKSSGPDHMIPKSFVGRGLHGRRRGEKIAQLPAFLPGCEDTQSFIFFQLQTDGLAVKDNLKDKGNLFRGFTAGKSIWAVLYKSRQEKVQHNIIVCKAFGLPGSVQGIFRYGFAVHIDIYFLALGGIFRSGVTGQKTFYAPSLVVIRAGAFSFIIPADLKTIHEKLPHIVPDPLKRCV